MKPDQYALFTEPYGSDEFQVGDLYLPPSKAIGLVCLFHGGFWKMPYDRFQLSKLAVELVRHGLVVWNIEYRRVGAPGGGYPGTLEDAVAAVNRLQDLRVRYDIDRCLPLYVAGHSAGGQLALWLGRNDEAVSGTPLWLQPRAVIGLAPVVDFTACLNDPERSSFVSQFLGGSPHDQPERCAALSPIERLPLGIRQVVFHGVDDKVLPLHEVQQYAQKAALRGDVASLVTVDGAGHMDFTQPTTPAVEALVRFLIADAL